MKGKVALVTGGASGIGRGISLAFAAKGVKVMVVDINQKGSQETVNMITDAGGTAAFFTADVSKEDQVKAMVDETVKTFGGLDYAANNAGIDGPNGPLNKIEDKDWQMVIAINLSGVFYGMKHEISYMLEHGGGAIVNTSSVAGLIGVENISPYVAAKHGVTGLTRSAALDVAKQGIRVNSVHPGGIRTPMLAHVEKTMPEFFATIEAAHPIGHIGEPSDIANAVVWLCSDEAAFVTGHQMVIDGGSMAGR